MKGIIHQEGIMILNIDASNLGAPNFTKQLISLNTLIVGILNTPLSSMGRSSTFFFKKREHRNNTAMQYHRSNGLNSYLQNIPSKHKKVHILLRRTFTKIDHI